MQMLVVQKVWGQEEWIVNNDQYCGKRLLLNKGWQCSLHFHKIKYETFYLQSGLVQMELGITSFRMAPGDVVDIQPFAHHRFMGLEDSVIIEFSTHHDDADTYRLEESREVQ
jgi:mannose-6-phosphate isomerase-like protein (cupin superfamily)